MAITAGIIERSIVREDPEPVARDTLDRLGEIEQQIQIAVEGEAGAGATTATVDITFDVEFVDGTDQRYSNLAEPQFIGKGAVIVSDSFVYVDAVVASYEPNDNGSIVGATVTIAAVVPGAEDTVAFSGYLCLTWQGWGTVPNEPADPDFTG